MEGYNPNIEVYSIDSVSEKPAQISSHLEEISNGIIKKEFEPKLEYLTDCDTIVNAVCKMPCHSPCQPPIPRPCTPC